MNNFDSNLGGYSMMNMMGELGKWLGKFLVFDNVFGRAGWVAVGVLLAVWLFKQIGKK